ncbi:hypothetical protein ASD54_08240 [Rhizobium sp. Root149]|nr:hypothetical protein ASD54_08240 [Rhizobium sp. Root149]
MTFNIPVIEKIFDKTEQQFGFVWIDINDYVDIFFHMSTNIANLPDRFYGLKALFRHAPRRLTFVELLF